MNTLPKLEEHREWGGTYRGVRFTIKHRNSSWLADHFPSGGWTYYVYIHESDSPRFAELWLADELTRISPDCPERVSHDYMAGVVGGIDLHGGITHYAKHGHTDGHRCVEVGCDYQHLYDEGHSYDAQSVAQDACRTIDDLFDKGILKEKMP